MEKYETSPLPSPIKLKNFESGLSARNAKIANVGKTNPARKA
jgi:hypothetical protein